MRCLFLSSVSDDYVASGLWDGLQEILGEENVIDATHNPGLHAPCPENPCSRISASRVGKKLHFSHGSFDLMVINACFLRQYPWGYAEKLIGLHQPKRIAFVEGWDGFDQVENPPFRCDAYFRRELDPRMNYPYKPHCLTMAAPRRWFCQTDDRALDIFYAANCLSHEARWEVLSKMWQTKTRHRSTGASCAVASDMERYFGYLRTHKLAICPTGAGGCMDCLRTWEVVANGCVPIFVGLPIRTIEPWFEADEIFTCHDPVMLPWIIDKALCADLKGMRDKMQANFLKNHTTAARAQRLLDILGV